MRKRSLFFEAQQDGASSQEEADASVRHPREAQCRALIKFEPIPQWFALYRKTEAEK